MVIGAIRGDIGKAVQLQFEVFLEFVEDFLEFLDLTSRESTEVHGDGIKVTGNDVEPLVLIF